MKKFMLRIIPIIFMVVLLATPTVFATKNTQQQQQQQEAPKSYETLYKEETKVDTVDTAVKKVWGTVLTILQICAIGALVFAGVKYMFASADGKADIKNGMLGLAIGAILVFAASSVISWILDAADDVI